MSAIRLNRSPPVRCRTYRQCRAPRGFALLSAIFLLVVLAALGTFMVSLSSVQQTTSAQDIQGTRAYQAARAGVEWGLYQIMKPEHTNLPTGQMQYVCPSSATALNTLSGALTGFSVKVQCTLTGFTEAAYQIGVYQITSTASFGSAGSAQYIERQVTAAVSVCRVGGIPCHD